MQVETTLIFSKHNLNVYHLHAVSAVIKFQINHVTLKWRLCNKNACNVHDLSDLDSPMAHSTGTWMHCVLCANLQSGSV